MSFIETPAWNIFGLLLGLQVILAMGFCWLDIKKEQEDEEE